MLRSAPSTAQRVLLAKAQSGRMRGNGDDDDDGGGDGVAAHQKQLHGEGELQEQEMPRPLEDVLNELPKEEAWESLEASVQDTSTRKAINLGVVRILISFMSSQEHQEKAAEQLKALSLNHDLWRIELFKNLGHLMDSLESGWSKYTHIEIARIFSHLADFNSRQFLQAGLPSLVRLLEVEGEAQAQYANVMTRLSCRDGNQRTIVTSDSFHRVVRVVSNTASLQTQGHLLDMMSNISLAHSRQLFEAGAGEALLQLLLYCEQAAAIGLAYDVARNLTLMCCKAKDFFIEPRGIEAIMRGLEQHNPPIRQRACGLIRNIGAGDSSSDAKVRRHRMAQEGLLATLLDIIEQDVDDVKLPAAYAAWNVTASPGSADLVVNRGLLPRVMRLYEGVTFRKRIFGESLKGKLVGILCCVSAHVGRQHVQTLCDLGLPDILHDLMISKIPERQPINAMLGLANLIGTIENHPLLQGDTSLFELFMDCLQHVRKGAHFHGAVYTEELLLPSLAKLAVSDSNKQLLKETGCVDLACTGFRVGTKGRVVDECIASLLLNMSFAYNLEADFKIDLVTLLEDIKARSSSKEAQKTAAHALFQHHQRLTAPTLRPSPNGAEDRDPFVMISCPEDWRPRMARLAEHLQSSGFLCRLGVGDSSGDTLQAMARAVEGAGVVLLCLCTAFKESPACRSECEYAQQLHKNIVLLRLEEDYSPDGWLKSVVEGRECLDLCFDDDQFADDAAAIEKEVSKHCATVVGSTTAATTSNGARSPPESSSTTDPTSHRDNSAPSPSPKQHNSDVLSLLTQLSSRMESGFASLQDSMARLDARVASLERNVSAIKRHVTASDDRP